MDTIGCWGEDPPSRGWQGILQKIEAIRAAAVMCDHNWILLTSKEYERRVWEPDQCSSWNIRGCLQCKELQFNNIKVGDWSTLLSLDLKDNEDDSPSLRAYFRRLRLFSDTIGQ